MKLKRTVDIYTDGACLKGSGRGGWAAVLICGDRERTIYGHSQVTTGNQMELRAAIEALKSLKYPSQVTLYSDSTIVVKGMNEWIELWKARGWRKINSRQEVANKSHWLELEEAAKRHDVTFKWIKGHGGNKHNELADCLAYSAMEDKKCSQ